MFVCLHCRCISTGSLQLLFSNVCSTLLSRVRVQMFPPPVLESCAHDVCWTCLVSCSVKHVCVARVEFNLFRSPLLFSIHNCLYHFVFNMYCYIYITYWNWRRSAYPPPRKDILIKTDCRILIRIIRCIPRTKMEFQQCIWIWYYSYHNTWYTNNWNLCNISWRFKYKMA